MVEGRARAAVAPWGRDVGNRSHRGVAGAGECSAAGTTQHLELPLRAHDGRPLYLGILQRPTLLGRRAADIFLCRAGLWLVELVPSQRRRRSRSRRNAQPSQSARLVRRHRRRNRGRGLVSGAVHHRLCAMDGRQHDRHERGGTISTVRAADLKLGAVDRDRCHSDRALCLEGPLPHDNPLRAVFGDLDLRPPGMAAADRAHRDRRRCLMTRGFLLGKFMPPHNGHLMLCDFARAYCDELTVLVCTRPSEPIDGMLRYEWMRELCPDARVVHFDRDTPQEPSDHPEFWTIWRGIVRQAHPEPIDCVFASEAYGARLAEEAGAKFVPFDPLRLATPVSSTAIREDPFANWQFLPPPVRAHYSRSVCLHGPESTGKSTLAAALA